jgi:hypothetical protein
MGSCDAHAIYQLLLRFAEHSDCLVELQAGVAEFYEAAWFADEGEEEFMQHFKYQTLYKSILEAFFEFGCPKREVIPY